MTLLKKQCFFSSFRWEVPLMVLLLLTQQAKAQQADFSMYHYTPFFSNPGQLGTAEDVRLMLSYRNQSIEAGDNFSAASLSGYYPIYLGNHRLVIGANFLNDQASDFISTNGGTLGVAFSVSLNRVSNLSLGIQSGYYQRSTGTDYTTDDQFTNGSFNPTIPSADNLIGLQKGYPSISAGLFYQLKDTEGREKAFIGGSMYNLLEPNLSFFDGVADELPLSIKVVGGYSVYQGLQFLVLPTFRWVNQANNNFVNLGSRFGYVLEQTGEGVKKIELGLWYNTNESGVFSLAYEQPNMTIAVSYDLPVNSDISLSQKGVLELAVLLRIQNKQNRNTNKRPGQSNVSNDKKIMHKIKKSDKRKKRKRQS